MAAEKLIENLSSFNSPGHTSKLMYPSNLFSDHTDYVKFQFFLYKGPFQGKVDGGSTTSRYNQATADYKVYPGAKNILMYMPEDISTGYQTDWSGKGFSNVAAEALRTAGAGGKGDGGGVMTGVTNLIKNTAGAAPTMGAETLAGAISSMGGGNVTTQDVLAGTAGVILNPNTELMFQGFKMRTFSLKFKMAPRNQKEAEEIREIIATFKQVSLPTLGSRPGGFLDFAGKSLDITESVKYLFGGDKPANAAEKKLADTNSNYIGVPGLVQVKFMSGGRLHKFLPQYKICAITDVSINYTPDGTYATYQDMSDAKAGGSSMVAYELQLTLAETKLVYSKDIVKDGASF